MPLFATTGGISVLSRKRHRAIPHIRNFRNHPKVPDDPQADGTFFCALHLADIGSAFTAPEHGPYILALLGPRKMNGRENRNGTTTRRKKSVQLASSLEH